MCAYAYSILYFTGFSEAQYISFSKGKLLNLNIITVSIHYFLCEYFPMIYCSAWRTMILHNLLMLGSGCYLVCWVYMFDFLFIVIIFLFHFILHIYLFVCAYLYIYAWNFFCSSHFILMWFVIQGKRSDIFNGMN